MLTRVFYISEIAASCTDIDIKMILGTAHVNNRRLDVTGMLAKSDGHFGQVLEGRTDVMPGLLAKIQADWRHGAVRMLLQDSIETRQFPNWSMGLIQREDMAEEMRLAHHDGCANLALARHLIRKLMAREP